MTELVTRTVKVEVRHSAGCKDRDKGSEWRRCKCCKSVRIYEGGGSGANRRVSARTRSWEKAEEFAQRIRDSWDPTKQELARLKAERERKQVGVREAVGLYTQDMVSRLGDNGTVATARSLLGDTRKADFPRGHLFEWLERLPVQERPVHIADITPAHLTQWRATWRFDDYTASQRWGMVRSFFNFCERQGWIPDSPARKLQPPRYKKGSRTAIFTDQQYASILDTVPAYEPENVPGITRENWQRRVRTFVELLRWSGMSLIDAVQWRPELVDAEGVLRYRRQKTGELATVPLPNQLVALLRSVPLERDSLGPEQPFRMRDYTPHSDTITWRKRLMRLFDLAGIKTVRNELGRERKPHPHMLRDTFAVGHLRHGADLHTVAKMLGHSSTKTTEKSYLPWVSELEQATISAGRAALERASPKAGKVVAIKAPKSA